MEDGGPCGRASAAVVALVVLLGACAAADEPDATARVDADSRTSPQPRAEGRDSGRRDGTRPRATASPDAPAPARDRAPGRTAVVTRVIDGDTVELGDGRTVRLVGIDTPERGECGFDRATADLVRLVEGRRVRLTRPGEDTDRYDRLLRYVDVGGLDAGLRLIEAGRAIARYDSRDGYGFHPREPRYVAAEAAQPGQRCARPAPAPPAGQSKPGGRCEAGYTPCVPVYPPDVDCADVGGPVAVRGSDPHGLDADGDGVACEG